MGGLVGAVLDITRFTDYVIGHNGILLSPEISLDFK